MEGSVTSYTGTSLAVNVDLTGGSGSPTDWNINLAGQPGATGPQGTAGTVGATGPTGPTGTAGGQGSTGATGSAGTAGGQGSTGATGAGYAGTSTTTDSIALGSTTITTQPNLAYVVGTRCRIASSANSANFMEGAVTAYTAATGSITVNVDLIGGSGTNLAAWNLSVAGQPGVQGATGPTGSAGGAGPTGATGPAGSAGGAGPTGATGAAGGAGPQGATGSTGPVHMGTSTTSLAIATGSKVFATQAGLALQVGNRVRAASNGTPANWMEGLITAYSGTSLTVNVDLTGGSGSPADWNINLTGQYGQQGATGAGGAQGATGPTGSAGGAGPTGATGPSGSAGGQGSTGATGSAGGAGPQGATGTQGATGVVGGTGSAGPGYTATSTTSFLIGTGSKVFTTQAGLAYLPGDRVRVAYSTTPTNFMEGQCTAYSGTSLTVNVDYVAGSGTFASWNIGLAGQVGATGPAGSGGAAGSTGATGASGLVPGGDAPSDGFDYVRNNATWQKSPILAAWAGTITRNAAQATVTTNPGTGIVTASAGLGTLATGQAVMLTGTAPAQLNNNAAYYIRVLSTTTFALYNLFTDAQNDTNRIASTGTATGWGVANYVYSTTQGQGGSADSYNMDSVAPIGFAAAATGIKLEMNLAAAISNNTFMVIVNTLVGLFDNATTPAAVTFWSAAGYQPTWQNGGRTLRFDAGLGNNLRSVNGTFPGTLVAQGTNAFQFAAIVVQA
jgi:hypothetical protein